MTDVVSANRKTPLLRADVQRNRQRILAAAREVFFRNGANAQIEEISRLAEVSPATVYRHFSDKDELADAVLALQSAEMVEQVDEIETICQLQAFIDRMCEHGRQNPEYNRLVYARLTAVGELNRPGIELAMTRLHERLSRQGELRKDVTPNDLVALVILVYCAAAVGERFGTAPPERTARLFVDALSSPSS